MLKTFTFELSMAPGRGMTAEERSCAERVLARLVAAAFAADHPELFGDRQRNVNIMGSRLEGRPIRKDQCGQGTMTAGEIYARVE